MLLQPGASGNALLVPLMSSILAFVHTHSEVGGAGSRC